ncbi:MAG: hypothetical protein ABIV11_02155 [Gemmatimonadaceae bacterium]
MSPSFTREPAEIAGDALTVVRVNPACPEFQVPAPALRRKAEHRLDAAVHEIELPKASVPLPYDHIDAVEDLIEAAPLEIDMPCVGHGFVRFCLGDGEHCARARYSAL